MRKTIPYSSANVGITTANISNKSFDTYAKLFSCFANVVSDDEGDISNSEDYNNQEWEYSPKEMPVSEGEQQDVTPNDQEETQMEMPPEETRREPVHVIFDVTEEVPQDSQDDDEPLKPSDIREWLHIHKKLGHMSWNQMKLLVEQGILPKKYKNCKALKCPGCLYGKQYRTPSRTSK